MRCGLQQQDILFPSRAMEILASFDIDDVKVSNTGMSSGPCAVVYKMAKSIASTRATGIVVNFGSMCSMGAGPVTPKFRMLGCPRHLQRSRPF